MKRQTIIALFVMLLALAGGGAYLYAQQKSSAPPVSAGTHAPKESGHEHGDEPAGAHALEAEPTDEHEHEGEPTETDAHAGESADAHAGESADAHAGHAGEGLLRLDAKQREQFGIKLAVAGVGAVAKTIALPGEVTLNADRVAHVTPRVPGIVRAAEKSVGDRVAGGEILAWLESTEMGAAKIDYMTKWSETACRALDLQRAQEVHDNTLALLELLETRPTIEKLRELNGQALGENRGKLLAAYADYVRAQADYARDRALAEKKIASSKDLQVSESELKKSEADYWATRESLSFQVRRDLLEARQTRRLHEIELKGARRRLVLLGLTADEIQKLEQATDARPEDAVGEEIEEKLAWYPLRAPFEGTIIEKHIALGEKLDDETDVFLIADLNTVWIDFNVYQKDLEHAAAGRAATIVDAGGFLNAEGTVAFVSPVVDASTRTALARVALSNADGRWRPGVFVEVRLQTEIVEAAVVVPKDAVQRLGTEAVVFVEEGEGLKAVPVTLGRENSTHVEIAAGLTKGRKYVAQGAYDLKAQMLTGGLDPHAGHGH